ncbi:chondrolectin isoform X2 [Dunckerocampus dactyliophorus]|uniref:chondrolectin isoform X2 n=1 Tax=Dunckerocampus dactyliophorus TaxID=161453 RepID=UPI002405DC14|nr:chondrolectin isoform X2 [Dunckerocampus dactyliophorus]
MDFMRLFGALIAVLFHNASAAKINGQRICRRGTERPCYKVSYIQDSRRRLTFQDARQACRADGGELLSIETESEQRLIERFIQQLHAADGDFWIGLRRSPQRFRSGSSNPGCPSQYYWLDGSKAKFRNWHWDEPSCGGEMCVVLYYQPSAPPDEEGHFLFQWNDDNCNAKNNYVCKYSKEKAPVFTEQGNIAHEVPTVRPNIFFTTASDEFIKVGQPESSVSFSDNTLYVPYILYATIPALLLLLLAVAGFFCYKQQAKRRKTETKSATGRAKRWTPTDTSSCPLQGPYAFSDITRLTHLSPDSTLPADFITKYPCTPAKDPQWNDYENVLITDRESGFVNNDIYETSRAQGRHGWVENEIYG